MVISYSQYPLLKMLEKSHDMSKHEGLSFLECDSKTQPENCYSIFKFLSGNWELVKRNVSKNIFIISSPFADAMEKSHKAFRKLNPLDILRESSPNAGVLLSSFNKFGTIYLIHKETNRAVFLIFASTNLLSAVILDLSNGWQNNVFTTNHNSFYNGYDSRMFIANEMAVLSSFLIFKKYAKVEIEQGKCGKTIHSKILKEKLRNNLPFDVNIMDSTWFTTICRNEGFKVRGHFRLQPKKNDKGEWIKELIYINEFEKHGYHRQAKILNDKSE